MSQDNSDKFVNNVICLQAFRDRKNASAPSIDEAKGITKDEIFRYQAQILGMDKVELLQEMVRFQEERSHLGKLTYPMMERGRILFKALEENAETNELRILARSYSRHLECEILEFEKKFK